jgi:Flp pilus assembly protein TadD
MIALMPQMSLEQALEWADELRAQGKFADAVSVCEQVAAAYPKSAFVLNRLGICLGDAKRLEDACKAFERATEMEPGFADAWS